MPRILAAILIGLGLAVSGASAQGLFCNPLVDSGIIGVTSGAAFGGTLAILLFESSLLTLVFAFAFGMLVYWRLWYSPASMAECRCCRWCWLE